MINTLFLTSCRIALPDIIGSSSTLSFTFLRWMADMMGELAVVVEIRSMMQWSMSAIVSSDPLVDVVGGRDDAERYTLDLFVKARTLLAKTVLSATAAAEGTIAVGVVMA